MDGEKIRESLSKYGFLSPALECVKAQYREQYSQAFAEVEAISDIAQGLIMAATINENEAHTLAALVFLQRSIRNSQAAVLLCERGLVIEAQTLTRTSVELAFYAGAVIKDAALLVRIAREGDVAERKQAEGLKRCSEFSFAEQSVVELQSVIDRAEGGGAGFSAHDAARVAGLMPFYETIYRGFSSMASHATLRSLDSSFEETEGGTFLISGPTTTHLEFTLGIVKTCLALAVQLLRENFDFD